MRFELNPLLQAVEAPPIAEVDAWLRGHAFPPDKPLLDVAQAVPNEPPPIELRDHLAAQLRESGLSRYTAILGLPRLREALAERFSLDYEGSILPEQTAITAGCNQAFCLAMMALAQAGDEVILPLPYYFNHQMLLEMQGVRPVHLPFVEARGGLPDLEDAARRITARTRAIVLITPNNPTGAEMPAEEVAAFYDLARSRGVALVLDETYRDFRRDTGPPHGLFHRPDWPESLIHLYSFSKAYNMPGYRVGSIVASARLLQQISKVVDCWMISPPTLGQEAALYALDRLGAWLGQNRQKILGRGAALRKAFEEGGSAYRLVNVGAYFAYVQHPFPRQSAEEVARRLAAEQNMLCLPGPVFGPGQDRFLRFAFANLEAGAMAELVRRLAADAPA